MSCRVVPVACLSLSSSARSFVRFPALQPTKPLRSPSLLSLFFLGLSPSLPTSHSRLTSAQQQQPPAQPSPAIGSPACLAAQPAHQPAQPVRRQGRPGSRQPSSPSLLPSYSSARTQEAGAKVKARSRSTPSTPRPGRDGNLSRQGIAADSRHLDLSACTCPPAPPSPKRRQSIPQRLFFFLPSCLLALLCLLASSPLDRPTDTPQPHRPQGPRTQDPSFAEAIALSSLLLHTTIPFFLRLHQFFISPYRYMPAF